MSCCLLCGGAIRPFLEFGPMPIANGFLRREGFASESRHDLSAGFCESCAMMQLLDPVPAGLMFHDRYPFFTSSSARMSEHFRRLAGTVLKRLSRDADPFVVEIGSNDGTMLQPFAEVGIRHLGVEPSGNVADAAEARGIATLRRFFDRHLAREIAHERGRADAILACNCFCHISDLGSLADGIDTLLKPDGVLVFEDPYAGDILRQSAYDQVYDEHVYYFSLASVSRWLDRSGLEVVDAQPQPVHGGSMRYTVARRGMRRIAPSVADLAAAESRSGLHRPEAYEAFRLRVEQSRDNLVQLLGDLAREGRRVVGYGATSKSTTVLNYCGITPDMIDFISDTTPEKQGLFSPGAHIPVRPHADFVADYPEFALLFAWNHSAEIMAKEEGFRQSGGRWIRYVPAVGVS